MQESDSAKESTFLKINFGYIENRGCDHPLDVSFKVSLPVNTGFCII